MRYGATVRMAVLATGLLLWAAFSGLGVANAADGEGQISLGPVLYLRDGAVVVRWQTREPVQGRVELLSGDRVVRTLPSTPRRPAGVWLPPFLPVPANWVHTVRIDGLDAGPRHRYRVVAGEETAGPFEFRAGPGEEGRFRLAVFGDTRTGHEIHRRLAAAVLATRPDVVLNTGDLVGVGNDVPDWLRHFAIERDLLASAPSWVAVGNHERVLGTRYIQFYLMLDPDAPLHGFVRREQYGGLRVLVLDSGEDLDEDEQREWLEKELRAASGDPTVRFLAVAVHAPPFSFSRHQMDDELRDDLHQLFRSSGVDIVFAGHNHLYERFIVDGLPYVVTGGGGARLYSGSSRVPGDPAQASLRVSVHETPHFVLVDVDPTRLRLRALDVESGAELDQFEIPRRRRGATPRKPE